MHFGNDCVFMLLKKKADYRTIYMYRLKKKEALRRTESEFFLTHRQTTKITGKTVEQMQQELTEKRNSVSASLLKTTAAVLMFINHFSVGLFWNGILDISSWYYEFQWYLTRASFVLYAFLIAEGMVHTGNRNKYILRLLAMAIASEFFYDELLLGGFPYWGGQNVFFTLFFGALAISIIDRFKAKPLIPVATTALILTVSAVLRADYGIMGVSIILLFYYLRGNKSVMLVSVAAAVFVLWFVQRGILCAMAGRPFAIADYMHGGLQEMHGILAYPLITLYNGKRGKQLPKLFYYLFYPGHLLAILMFVRLISA